jgi:hypothetical protein
MYDELQYMEELLLYVRYYASAEGRPYADDFDSIASDIYFKYSDMYPVEDSYV